jgi:hypothetical protein
MKKWILLFFVLFFSFIFSVKLQSDSIPNIFLIEAIVLLFAYLLQIVLRIIVLFKIKKKAEKVYDCDFRTNNILKLIFSVFPKHISLHNSDNTLNLIIIYVRRKHAKYHFDSKKCVEVYVGNRETYRTGKVQYSIGKNVTWKLISSIKISCNDKAKTVFILTKAPMDVTSADKKANEFLANGDPFFNDCIVYTKNNFMSQN